MLELGRLRGSGRKTKKIKEIAYVSITIGKRESVENRAK